MIRFPSAAHERAVTLAVEHFSGDEAVEAVLLVGSCARGKAVKDVDLCVVLPDPDDERARRLEQGWERRARSEGITDALAELGPFSHLDIDFTDGEFAPKARGWTSGPDGFELEIGNYVAYSVCLWQRSDVYDRLRRRWLPYYDDDLRERRLSEVLTFCLNNIDHVAGAAERGLIFHAFHRLYDAFREFLQALHISRRVYPIAYDKWIEEQVAHDLGLPELYLRLPRLIGIDQLRGEMIVERAEDLRGLTERYVGA